MLDYDKFLSGKRLVANPAGLEPGPVNPALFPFQADIVRWALRRGRSAILVPDPVEAEAVRDLYRAAAEGVPMAALSRKIDRAMTVTHRRLRQPAYAGGYRAPEGVRWGHHEPIVPRDLWDTVQARLDRQAGSAFNPPRFGSAPLSGLLICPQCTRSMRMESRRRQRAGLAWWYACPGNAWHRACSVHVRRRIPEAWIVETLWPALLAWAHDPRLHVLIADCLNAAYRQGADDGSLAAEVRSLEARVSRLTEAIATGLVPDVRGLASQLGDAQRALDAARSRLAASRQVSRSLLTPDAVGAALSAHIASGAKPSRETLHRALSSITPADDGYIARPAIPDPISDRSGCRVVGFRMDLFAVLVAA